MRKEAVNKKGNQIDWKHRGNRRYKEAHPEIVWKRQRLYTDKHPEVHQVAVQRCIVKNPEVHEAVVKSYRGRNHRGAQG